MTDSSTVARARTPRFVPALMSPRAYRWLEDFGSASVAVIVEVGGVEFRYPDLWLAGLVSLRPSKCAACLKSLVIMNQQGENTY